MNLLWITFFAVHPFILRISAAPSESSHEAHRLFAYIFGGGHFMRIGKDTFFYFAVIACFLFIKKRYRELPNIERWVLFGFLAFSFANQIDFLFPSVFYQYILFGCGLLCIKLMYESTNKDFGKSILTCLFYCSIAHSVWAFFSYYGIRPYRIYAEILGGVAVTTQLEGYVPGALNQPNMSAAYLALCLPAFLVSRKRLYWLPVPLGAMFVFDSVLPIFTAIAVFCFYFYSKVLSNNYIPYMIASFLMVAFFFTGINGMDNLRFAIWENAFKFSNDPLIFGNGLGWFADTFHLATPSWLRHARQEHNEFISLYFAFGVAGIVGLVTLLARAVKKADPIYGAGLFAVFINCYGNFLFHLSTLALLGIFYYTQCLKSSQEDCYVT